MQSKLKNLTEEQSSAYKKFLGFLLSEEKEFYLFGKAGSGKTYLVQHLLKNALKEYKNTAKLLGLQYQSYTIELTAPTHKAVEALSKATNKSAKTIFSFMNIGVTDENDLSKLNTKNVQDFSNKLLFIDECSMLSKEVIGLIRKHSRKSKIVFIGDNYQLPPVNENPHWNYTPEKVTATLTGSIRNKDSEHLQNLCAQMRETVDTLQFNKIKLYENSINHLSDEEAIEWLKGADTPNKAILCYTNEKVSQYVKHFKRTEPERINLIAGNTYSLNNALKGERGLCVTCFPNTIVKIKEIESPKLIELKNGVSIRASKAVLSYSGCSNSKFDYQITTLVVEDPLEYQAALKLSARIALNAKGESRPWDTYYYLKYSFADLRPTFITTVHKSQGSTYDEVLIDLDSFNKCKDPKVAARLLYVAVSRAKSKVNFYSTVPCKYGELVNAPNELPLFN